MGFRMTNAEFVASLALFFLVVIVVFLQFANEASLNKPVDATYINGTLTANGILLAVLTASVISGGRFLRQVHFTFIKACFGVFIMAVVNITASEVQRVPTLFDFVFLQISLILAGVASFVVISRISKVMRTQNLFLEE